MIPHTPTTSKGAETGPRFVLSLYRGLIPCARTMKEIATEVAERHGISLTEMRGRSRPRYLAWPRQEAMWRIRQERRLSFPKIGRFFGRDHTTVIHGVRAYAKRLAEAADA